MSKVNKISHSAAISAYNQQAEALCRKKYNVVVNLEFNMSIDGDNIVEAERKALKEMQAKFPSAKVTIGR